MWLSDEFDTAFLDRETAHRLGDDGGRRWRYTPNSLRGALAASSPGTLHWVQAQQAATSPNAGRVRNSGAALKGKKVLDEARQAGLDYDVLIDMQDARKDEFTFRKTVAPVLSFNRRKGCIGRVLWPMQHIHGVARAGFSGGFNPKCLLPFAQRKDKFVWRGGLNGTAVTGENGQGPEVSARFLLNPNRSRMEGDALFKMLCLVPRIAFVTRFKDHQLADVGLTIPQEIPLLSSYVSGGMTQLEMTTYRYIVVLPGADLPTSFFWSLASGSLCLVMDHDWESFASCHFRPWEHYLPFASDGSNFEERLDWARSNPQEAEAMAARAQATMAAIDHQPYRDEANRRVIAALRARMGLA